MGTKNRVASAFDSDFSVDIEFLPLIFGIAIVLLGAIDMIVLYIIPNQKIKENKKKYPDATFEKPKTSIVAIHFTLHSLVILLGVFLILLSLEHIMECDNYYEFITISLIIISILIFTFWIVQLCLCISQTQTFKSTETLDRIVSILTNKNPANLIFIYSKDTISYRECKYDSKKKKNVCSTKHATCYSKNGVSIPITTNLTVFPSSNFSDPLKIFHLNLKQTVTMSTELSNQLFKINTLINNCNRYSKVIEYYPLVAGSYIISDKKTPSYVTKGTRIASSIFGVGIYYEMSSKSIPIIHYEQSFTADVVPSFNYDLLWTDGSCRSYGGCSRYNSKPKP